MDDYGLDLHSQMILEEYRENRGTFLELEKVVRDILKKMLRDNNIYVAAIESRVKEEKSLAGKLERKGHKYSFLSDITDIFGARVVTFYLEEVDKIAVLVEKAFEVDWENSVDKRKMLELDRFGYMSLHYICKIPQTLYYNPEYPAINDFPFEIQMRTTLQHAWAVLDHDTGYKSGVEVPKEHLRNINRLAGLLELADEQFSRIRTEITEYRRRIQTLVADGNFDEVNLDGDTFRSYLELDPFKKLIAQMASINQAEIYKDSMWQYLPVLINMGMNNLGDVERMRKEFSEAAYQLTLHQMAGTDLDIIAQSLALQNLCAVYIVKNGGGEESLVKMFEQLNGASNYTRSRAHRIMEEIKNINVI